MKKIIFLLICIPTFALGQVTEGEFTRITLASDKAIGSYQSNGCYSYDFGLYYRLFPFLTGMDLYIRVDSISGSVNSVQFKRDTLTMTMNANDTMLMNGKSVYVYFLNNATVYFSLLAIGIPQIAGEHY